MAPQKRRLRPRMLVSLSQAVAGLVLVVFPSLASAGTILHVTGSGSLTVGTTGTLYLDFGELDATDILLEGQESILVGRPFPSGVPAPPLSTIELPDVMGAQSLSLLGDVFVETLDFAGSVRFSGQRIHVSGGVAASGSITLIAGRIGVGDGAIVGGDLPTGCGTGGGGVVVQVLPSADAGCRIDVIGPPPGGSIFVGDERPGSAVGPVPEPTSALLFAVGAVVLMGRKPGR